MMRRLLILCALGATPAVAMDDLEAMTMAGNLGTVIAAESFCGLTYDQTAIANYIRANVPPDRIGFADQLQTVIMMQGYSLDKMSQSAKTAHCTSITQTAKFLGFVK